FVGIEAMALQFSDAPEARPGIVNPENSAAGIEIVFGRIEQPPILREDAVSAEVAIRRGFKDDWRACTVEVERDRELTRPARKGNSAGPVGAEGNVVAPSG